MFATPRVNALIPAFNEESAIGGIVKRSGKYVDQVIVVDDGSLDKTSKIAEMSGAKVIKHHENRGKGAAIRTGFNEIKNADIIVTLDGDGQHNPEEIPKLIKPIITGEADIVNGSRYLGKSNGETPSYRRLGQKILDIATNLCSGIEITDSQSGFRAFASHTMPAFKFSADGFYIESEMIINAAKFGSKIKEVDIKVSYDEENSHKRNPWSHGLGVLLKILQNM